jgi:hypothetical protein
MGLQLQEPMSLILDWLLAIICFVCYVKIRSFKMDTYTMWWSMFFLFMGTSMFAGGIAHFFSFYAEFPLKLVTWSLSAIAVFSAEMASLSRFVKNQANILVKMVLSLKLLIIVLLAFWYFDFKFIKLNSTIGMIGIVLLSHAYLFFKKARQKATFFILAGVLWMILPASIHAFNINLHLWFNRDDFAHVLMIFTFYLFYKGISYQYKHSEDAEEHLIPQST